MMKNLAPNVTRKRLMIELIYSIAVDKNTIQDYFSKITADLKLKAYGKPIIFSPGGKGKEENKGYDAFVPLIDSGISVYVWTSSRFVSLIIYTCKDFDSKKAVETTKKFFNATKSEFMEF
ncbi:S-adenosylmethionine decarboxylase [Candidatus Woesearchaeota archaeon]|nr:S-adenosylmethionine decarboxylase [Candidatus Woesearchaeota archaeon]